ncbi:MAG: right-handed parallel beta-helix repeat-containing protein, partial [Phycisphaerae bacterium]|nr:right-handed parallel beta-helix repeat-containing protein [Phycisphaerae bacterium]
SKSSASAVAVAPTTKPVTLPATNIAPNPGAEKGQGNKLPEGWGFYWANTPAEVGVSAQVRHSGKRSAYLKVTTFGEDGYANMGLAAGSTKGYTSPDAIAVKPNTKYHFSFYIRGEGFTREITVRPWGFKSDGKGRDRTFPGVGVIPTDKWTRYVGSFTTKEETMRVVLMFRVFGKKDSQVKPGAIFYVDDVHLGAGEPAAAATMKPAVRPTKATEVTGKTYYVSASGDDSADGLAEKTAWRTITRAAKVAAAGDTVKIKAGKYESEQVVITNSGTKDNPIVFEGYGGTPVLDGKNRTRRCVLVNGREHVVVRNLKLINYMVGVRILRSKHIVMDRIVCHDMGKGNSGAGFSVSGRSQNCTFSNCQTRSCAMHGLNIMGHSHHNLIDGCTFYITTGEKLSSDYGIYTENAHHNTIRNSTIKNLNPKVKGHCGHGIALRISSHHNKAIDCKCYNLLEAFVAGEDAHDNEFINCRAYDTAGVWKRTRHSDGLVARFGAHDNKFINC